MTKQTIPAPSLMDMKRVTTHPGEMLNEEFLKPLGMSGTALAHKLGVAPNRITSIVSGHRSMSADTAIRLGQYFGMSAAFWMNLQSMYDLTTEVVAKRSTYKKIVRHEQVAA